MSKVALITGATRGIGKQIAITLAREGFDIAVNYRTANDSLNETIEEIEGYGVKCIGVQGDVAVYEDCENMTKQVIEKFGRIDVLVNNAGITRDMLFIRMKEEDFKQVVDVNLIGTFNMTKNVSQYMIKQRSGRIINISSIVGIHGNAGQANYAASKAGIIGLTKSLAKELAGRNILVNAIAPGFFVTAQNEKLLFNEDGTPTARSQKILNSTPMGRYGEAHELIGTLLYLVNNDASGFVNGVCIPVDGAFSAYSGV